jgi:hypothetical protein
MFIFLFFYLSIMIGLDEDCIYKNWIHSHEEDTEDKKVYRPSTFEFPPSRGRDGFEIKENGEFVLSIMGPTDRPEKIVGNFTKDSNKLNVELVSIQKSYIMTILSCDENQLVIQK